MKLFNVNNIAGDRPASILRKSISGRRRPVSYPDGPMTADIDLHRILTRREVLNSFKLFSGGYL